MAVGLTGTQFNGFCTKSRCANGRKLAGLAPVRDLQLLDRAVNRSLDYRANQIAEEMMRWWIIKEGMERRNEGVAKGIVPLEI